MSPRFEYPFEEFSDHTKAMKTVRAWQYTVLFGHLGTDQTDWANRARVVEYFCDSYPNQKEALYKAERFLVICDYLARHTDFFTREGLLESEHDTLLSVDPALLRAVHLLFTSGEEPAVATPKEVLSLAWTLKNIER